MSITCDRCHNDMKHELLHLALGGFAVTVAAAGRSFSDAHDLCTACLEEITKNGKVINRSIFDSLSSSPPKGGEQ